MNADDADHRGFKHIELTEEIIKAFYKVYNILGYGFLEKVYENAMLIELTESGLKCRDNPHFLRVFLYNILVEI